jgi:hypothetical protein
MSGLIIARWTVPKDRPLYAPVPCRAEFVANVLESLSQLYEG